MKKSANILAIVSLALVTASCSPVTTLPQLKALQQSAYMYAGIVAICALLLSILFAIMVPYKGGKDRSYVTRRIIYVTIGLISAVGYFLFNNLYVSKCIKNPGFASKYLTTTIIGDCVIIGLFVVLGIVIALLFRRSKFATVYFKPKKK